MPTGYALSAMFALIGFLGLSYGIYYPAAILFFCSIGLSLITLYAQRRGY